MRIVTAVCSLLLAVSLMTGCGSSKSAFNPDPLNPKNVNLVFAVSEDLAYQAPGDINSSTANLTNQGLQRSLQMATFLRHSVLGNENVDGLYALQPMSHLQTAGAFPDMVAIESIQQFAMLNQITLSSSAQGWVPFTANSYPLNVSYAEGTALPGGVASPLLPCPACQGINFNDKGSANESLLTGIITANVPGFYVLSTPWETASALLAIVNQAKGNSLTLPAIYQGPNYIYAISIAPSGLASLVTYNSNLTPAATYPALPSPVATNNACTAQTPFNISVTQGVNGATIPSGANTNETLYMIRHAEAHPCWPLGGRQLRWCGAMAIARAAERTPGEDCSRPGVVERSGSGHSGDSNHRRKFLLGVCPAFFDCRALCHRQQPPLLLGCWI